MNHDEDHEWAAQKLRARAARARNLAETALDADVIATIENYAKELDIQAASLEQIRS
jgi:hypothetical protein